MNFDNKGDHNFSEMVLPPIDKKFIKEKVVIEQSSNTANHDFTRYSIYDTDADQKDLILIDNKKHFDRRGKKVQSSSEEEENKEDRIQLHTVNSI